jgi:ParB/RepB/Spo0J family partition protein
MVLVDDIDIPDGRRKPSHDKVEQLAQSMEDIGLRTPITVRYYPNRPSKNGESDDSIVLVAGAHRLAAAKLKGWDEIECFIVGEEDLKADLWEVDENLCRAKLSDAEEAAAIVRRKELYEALHPQTKHGATGGTNKGKARSEVANLTTSVDRFTKDTAKATGKSERSVQRAAKRGEDIGTDNLLKVTRTSLDKGVELDALASMPLEERMPIIERAVAGEEVTARVQSLKSLKRSRRRRGWRSPQRVRADIWNQLRDALDNLTGMPLPSDVVAIARQYDKAGLVDITRLEKSAQWLEAFAREWRSRSEATDRTAA